MDNVTQLLILIIVAIIFIVWAILVFTGKIQMGPRVDEDGKPFPERTQRIKRMVMGFYILGIGLVVVALIFAFMMVY